MIFVFRRHALAVGIAAMIVAACQGLASPGDECSTVDRIAPDSPEGEEISQFVLSSVLLENPEAAGYHPDIAEVRSIDRLGDWMLIQAGFTSALEPAIFAIREETNGFSWFQVVWAGQAENGDVLLQTLQSEQPDLPPMLVRCLRPAEWFLLSNRQDGIPAHGRLLPAAAAA